MQTASINFMRAPLRIDEYSVAGLVQAGGSLLPDCELEFSITHNNGPVPARNAAP
jgi:hypothetical protein